MTTQTTPFTTADVVSLLLDWNHQVHPNVDAQVLVTPDSDTEVAVALVSPSALGESSEVVEFRVTVERINTEGEE